MEERERRADAREVRRGGESVSSAASSGIGCETERDRAGEWGESVSVTDGGDMVRGGGGERQSQKFKGAAETKKVEGGNVCRQQESGHDTALQLSCAVPG